MIEPIAHEEDRIDRQLIELENNPQAAHDTTICNLHKELETLADELKTPALDDPHEAEPACQGAIKRIQTLAGQERETSAGTGQTAATSDLEPHSVIGQYQILAKVGQGGMGAVYRVRHTKLDKIVALKVLPEDRLEKSDAVVRFEREMKAVGKIEHPHLVRALDAGEAEGSHYLVMEYVDGIDLSRLLKEQGTLSVADACELIRQAALGLQAAFQSGMVHRDIKPANLMLARQDYGPPIVKVLDLGLARLSDDSGQVEAELTADNQIMGTLDFMAPEQAGSSRRVDTRADVYSLGATLFTLLTGQPPFHSSEHQTIVQKLSALANQPLPSLRALRADVPQGLVQVVEKMLAKDRENRYAEPGDVAEALKPFANNAGLAGLLEDAKTVTSAIHSGRSTASWAISSTDATIRLKSPRRSRWAIAAVLLLVLVPLLVLYAGTILRFTTNQGELVIDVDDPDIEVQVIQNGVVVKDKTKDREFTLTAMNGEVEVYEKDGVKLATKEFQLTRGGKTTVRVWLEELADVRNAKAGPEKQETSPLDVPTKNFALEFQKDQITLESLRYDGSHPLTIEAWATPRQVHFDQPRVVFSSNAGLAMSLKGDAAEQTGFWSFDVWPPDYLKNPKVSPPLRLGSRPVKFTEIIGRPTHLAICLGDSRVALFINGQLAKQFEHEGLNSAKIQQDAEEIYKSSFLIGSGRGNGDSFDGRIDELRVSKVLRYRDNFTPAKRFEPDEHTLALYHFDEGSGDVLKDSSGNGHHGKIVGATWVNLNADREVAEWVLSKGGDFDVVKNGQFVTIRDIQGIPSEPFTIVKVVLKGIKEVNDADMARLTALSGLVHVYLHGTGITDAGLAELAKLETLGKLHLHGTQVTDAGFEHLQKALPNCKITWDSGVVVPKSNSPASDRELASWKPTPEQQAFITEVANLPAEEQLATVRRKLEEINPGFDGTIEHRLDLDRVVYFFLKSANVTQIWPIRALGDLETLRLAGGTNPGGTGAFGQLTDLSPLAGMPLTSLTLDHIPTLSDLSPLKGMPLTTFYCTYNSKITDLSSLADMPLTNLQLHNCTNLKDAAIEQIQHLEELTTLNLSNTKITDAGGMPFLKNLTKLQTLSLGATRITDDGLAELKRLTELTGLDLSQKSGITEVGLGHLTSFTKLKRLNLRDNRSITDTCVEALSKLKHLEHLDILATKITAKGIEELHQALPNCRIECNDGTIWPTLEHAETDRRVAEEILALGGVLRLNFHGGSREVRKTSDLPQEPFALIGVSFSPNPQITDEDLVCLKDCQNLNWLHLNGTPQLGDAVLSYLRNPQGFELLYLAGTQITDAGLAYFKNCRSLAQLHLSNMKITDIGVENFQACENLESLHLENTQITDAGLGGFKNAKGLTSLNLRGANFGDVGLAHFQGCPDLRGLQLPNTGITDAGLAYFKACLELRTIDLSRTAITDAGLANFRDCQRLTRFSASHTKIRDAGFAHFANCSQLGSLDLNFTKIADASVPQIAACKKLTDLYLRETSITEAGIAELQKALPKCKITWDGGVIEPQTEGLDVDRRAAEAVLKAGGTVEIWMRGSVPSHRKIEKPEDLPSESFSVKVISFSNVKGITDESLKVLVGLKSLYAIYLHDAKVTDAGLAYLAQVPNLENANFHGTQITDAGLPQLTKLPRLGMLSLSDTKVVTERLEGLRKLPWVRELHLHGKMTKSRFLELAELHNLRRLYVSKESQVTEADVATFQEGNPDCRVFVNKVLIGADPVRGSQLHHLR